MRFLWIIVALLSSPALAQDFPTANAGNWHGVGVQIDGFDWGISVAIGPEVSEVEYPSLNCGGQWTYLKVTDEQILASERITVGINECLDGGLVRVSTHDENSLIYRWFDHAGKVAAAAILIEGELDVSNYKALLSLTIDAMGIDFIEGPNAIITVGENKT